MVARYTYDAWGKVLSVTDANGNANTSSTFIGNVNPIRYRGYYYDTETGWYYLNSRYYDPEVKQFINEDAILDINRSFTGLNLFVYCNNNPVMYSDPSGYISSIDIYGSHRVPGGNIDGTAKYDYSAVDPRLNLVYNLPLKGEPNSTATDYDRNGNPKQERDYDSEGKAKRDTDYGHPNHHPELQSPHYHDWEWDLEGNPSRGDAYNSTWEKVIAAGTVVVCVVGVVAIVADNATGIGVADDFLLPTLGTGIADGLIKIFA